MPFNVGADKCLDLPHASTRPGTRFQLFPCHSTGDQAQVFIEEDGVMNFNPSGSSFSYYGGHCLDAAGASKKVGTPLIAYTCHGRANQRWDQNRDGLLIGRASGLCARATGTQTGAGIVLAKCDRQDLLQVWGTNLAGKNDMTAPTAPQNPKLSKVTCNKATLTWTASTDRVGVSRYVIFVDGLDSTEVDAPKLTAEVPLTANAKQVIGLHAADKSGNLSQPETRIEVTTPRCT